MTGFGCVCSWCLESYEATVWRAPFWCDKCVSSWLRFTDAESAKEAAYRRWRKVQTEILRESA